MSSNHTEHYSLSQWEAEDKVLRTDFNEDNEKIDAALAAHAAGLAKLTAAAPKLGNCQVFYGSYRGTGTSGQSNPNSLTFDCRPVLVFLIDFNGALICLLRGNTNAAGTNSYASSVRATWGSNTVSWYGRDYVSQMNSQGDTYNWVALCKKD